MVSRNPQQTRERLLHSAYQEIHAHGFQGMRVDEVLRQSNLQKGAFYHHFSSKTELAYAVLEEQIAPLLESIWITPLADMDDPVRELPAMLEELGQRVPNSMLKYGCPLNNLAQEMSPLDQGFRDRVNAIFNKWSEALSLLFEQAKEKEYIRKELESDAIASFLIASVEGCLGVFKVKQSVDYWSMCCTQISHYLESLRPKKGKA